MATKIHVAEQSYTHLVTKPHYHKKLRVNRLD